MSEESLWRVARRAAFRTWRRDLLAYPVVALLTFVAMTALYGRSWFDGGWRMALPAFLLGCVSWPVALWLLDRIFGRYHTPS